MLCPYREIPTYTGCMNLAIVCDWLTTFGGAERTLAEFHATWPESPIFTTVARHNPLENFRHSNIYTSRLQPLYRMIRKHQVLLPLMPRAIEHVDLRGFDVIVSSSHAVGKGIIPPSGSVHVCYCHTPMRYAWEMEKEYLEDFRVPRLLQGHVKRMLSKLRRWDLSTAKRVDVFIANSTETARRIERIYGRDSIVISPPVHDRFFQTPLIPAEGRQTFLAVGRLVPYKRFDLLIEAANALQFPLTIAGTGQEEQRLRSLAGPTVTFRGQVTDEELPELYASAKALLFPAHEDAGLVPVEAQACGTPVIAYAKGGTLDTVLSGKTGLFFNEQSVESLQEAMEKFSQWTFNPENVREHARQFSSAGFRDRISAEVQQAWECYHPRHATCI